MFTNTWLGLVNFILGPVAVVLGVRAIIEATGKSSRLALILGWLAIVLAVVGSMIFVNALWNDLNIFLYPDLGPN